MPNLTIDNWMVAWNPRGSVEKPNGAVEVGPWPDKTGWSSPYLSTAGCCNLLPALPDAASKIARMFINFHTLVVRDGVDPQAAHREFIKIDEYRRRISPDIEGAGGDNEE